MPLFSYTHPTDSAPSRSDAKASLEAPIQLSPIQSPPTPPERGIGGLKVGQRASNPYESSAQGGTTVICYDTETSDADSRFAQILQFAAIEADTNLTERRETSLKVRRLPYIVHSPEALRVTGFDAKEFDDLSLPTEFEAAQTIRSMLAASKGETRIFLTFNGPRFDDELLRTTFYRCLLDPYVTSGGANTRVDLLSLAQFVACGAPDVLKVNRNGETGKLMWRLQALCEANGIAIKAHDALGDARATIDLARIVKDSCPWAWMTALRGGRANRVEQTLNSPGGDGTVWLFRHFGSPEIVPCLPLGHDGRRRWLLADLRRSPEALKDVAVEGADPSAIGNPSFQTISAAKCPIIISADDRHRFPIDFDVEQVTQNTAAWRAAAELRRQSLDVFRHRTFAVRGNQASEERIYDGFFEGDDKARMGAFLRASSWAQRAAITFDDPRLKDFAARLVLCHGTPDDFQHAPGGEAELRLLAAEALDRPFGHADSRWMSLERARCSAGDNLGWTQWAEAAFPSDAASFSP